MQRARKSAAWVLMRKSVLRLAFVLCALEVVEWESIWLGGKCELVEVILVVDDGVQREAREKDCSRMGRPPSVAYSNQCVVDRASERERGKFESEFASGKCACVLRVG